MKHKGLITIFIAVLFTIISVFAVFSVFTVKHIDTVYAVYQSGRATADKINAKLSEYEGKNLVFIDAEDIINDLKGYTYFEMVTVKKVYPNSIKVEMKERRARFNLFHEEKYYVVSSDGFVLEEVATPNPDLLMLTLSTEKEGGKYTDNRLAFESVKVGEYLISSDDLTLKSAFEIINTSSISGFVKEVGVYSAFDTKTLLLKTATEVDIEIQKLDVKSVEKANALVNAYENIDDYLKANSTIVVFDNEETNEVQVQWTKGA